MSETPTPESENEGRLTEISRQLEQATQELRAAQDDPARAGDLAQRCADLASSAAAEVDRLARVAPAASVPGQEELL